jgi:uncharacterized protein YbjT (DUF2867 family)
MILVTGAAGQAGSRVIREFSRQGVPVRALVRSRARARALEGMSGVEVIDADLLQAETLGRALDGVERALLISSADERLVETQCAFIDAAERFGLAHIVKWSGKEANVGFDATRFRFVRMHEEIERYLERSSLAWTVLQPSQFMQVYLREARTIAGEGELRLAMEGVRMSPVDLDDVAKVACALMRRDDVDGKTYQMTGPEALSMAEVAERICEAIGKPVRYVNICPEERRQAVLAAGALPYFADALDEQGAERRRCPESRVYLETHETFGVRPTPFAEFARRHAAILRGESAGAPVFR